ncbi:hypothetical protein BSPLISOX_3179 [uncultured Gammaproteobacteria bacterium]|jgi:hypothetical protein|nr:hypothetical protein [uncultured Gammaproteobacteria bacterium]CAC9480202.1 hypothetical protein [uncultured Gammaproteobacteria bacterium]VVH64150.1 hypothetical protein BSPLISOX_3179 [uncultured Gammaproteobacteria bacterium]
MLPIGIDISKASFDVAFLDYGVLKSGQTFDVNYAK